MKRDWNRLYKTRGRFYLEPHEDFHDILSKLKAYSVEKVVDLGCGSGRHSIALAEKDFTVTAVDYSDRALDLAKKWAKNKDLEITFKKSNIYKKLPFNENKFDAALAVDSLHYGSREDLENALDEIRRIIKSGGLLFLTLPIMVGEPVVTHLVFTEDEISGMLKDNYRILNKSIDSKGSLSLLCILK